MMGGSSEAGRSASVFRCEEPVDNSFSRKNLQCVSSFYL
jgi:hypothetical protein